MRLSSSSPYLAGIFASILLIGGMASMSGSSRLGSAMARARAPVVRGAVTSRMPAPGSRMAHIPANAGITGLTHVGATEGWTVPQKMDKVYVYDHCPFCVRVRMIYGLKNIRHDLIWLQNDDKETPMAMHPQNKKVLPIVDQGGKIIIESMDIVKAVDEDAAFGAPILKPGTGRTDIDAWVKGVKSVMGSLSRPRYIQSYLPEFAFKSARDTFVLNHPIDKAKYSKGDAGIFQEYEEALSKSDEYLSVMNEKIQDVEAMIDSTDSVSPGGLSYDDIAFFARMRGLTMIKGLQMGPKLTAYMENMAAKTEIPLYTNMQV